jgi:uncharacterized protein
MIFVDTSAWVALTDKRDEFHRKAHIWFQDHTSNRYITSNLVVIETLGWIRYRCGKKIAIEAGQRLLAGSELQIERVTVDDEYQTWLLFQKIDGRGVSMIDTTSFTLMRRLKVKEAFTFDEDFKQQGFTSYPG